jgi:uncharacterized protein YbaP (TraB family)
LNPRVLVASLLLCLVCSGNADADEGQHVFWEVAGNHNTVYLLGSVHLLHKSDKSLPAVTEAAFQDAETVVEELDVFAAATEMTGNTALALQMLPQGQSLAGVLGPVLYARLKQDATKLSIDTDFLTRFQPWYVAMLLMQTRLMKAGFDPLDGVDYQIAERTRRENKPLRGLETALEQLAVFAHLPMSEQRDFLQATLDEADVNQELADITAAWRRGDLLQLESLLRSGAAQSPAFFKALTTDRNLRWLPQIETMLRDPQNDFLVVVGALHMVGDNGLVELLRRKGYVVKRR